MAAVSGLMLIVCGLREPRMPEDLMVLTTRPCMHRDWEGTVTVKDCMRYTYLIRNQQNP